MPERVVLENSSGISPKPDGYHIKYPTINHLRSDWSSDYEGIEQNILNGGMSDGFRGMTAETMDSILNDPRNQKYLDACVENAGKIVDHPNLRKFCAFHINAWKLEDD